MRSNRLPGLECETCPRCHGSTYEPGTPYHELCQTCWGIGLTASDPTVPWQVVYRAAQRTGLPILPHKQVVQRYAMTMKDCERCPDCHGSGWSASTAYHIGRSGGCPTCQGVGAIPKQPTTGAITRAFRVDKHRDNGKSAIKWTNDAATYISLYKTAPNKRQPKSLKVLRHYHDAGRKP